MPESIDTPVDPRRLVVRDIIDRLERPRFYAGDWASDQADRILAAIDAIDHSQDVTALRDALESMCDQYLAGDDGALHHRFMSAGEDACVVLCRIFPDRWRLTPDGAEPVTPLAAMEDQ